MTVTTEKPQTDHRRLGVDLFNDVWELNEKKDRTRQDDEKMLHAAHASRYHWGECGEPVNFARGEWQLSRVYALLGRPEPAIHHARRSLEFCQENGIGDFDLAFAYEALARGHCVAENTSETERHLAKAREAGESIAKTEDKDWFLENLQTIKK